MAAQLILIKGPFFLSLALWMAVANTSLPVPLSPVKRIGVGVLQIRDKIFFNSIIRYSCAHTTATHAQCVPGGFQFEELY